MLSRRTLCVILNFLLLPFSLFSLNQNPNLPFPPGPKISSRSAILLDYQTGVVLFEKDADLPIPPASLTKIIAAHTVFVHLEKKGISLDTLVPIPEEAWSVNAPPSSSLMFLGPNQRVSLEELLKGLLVTSGNDAAIALAFFVSGSPEAFVEQMNREVANFGFSNLYFADSSGYSSNNSITARDFASFLREFLNLWPESLEKYFSIKEMTYPLPQNRLNGNRDTSITQSNRNALLWEYPGADGFKTGYIGESGHNLAFTAEREGRRLIGVTLTAGGSSYQEEFRNRFKDAMQLLDYGFENFVTLKLGFPEPKALKVWKGREREIGIGYRKEILITIPKELVTELQGTVTQYLSVVAPVRVDIPLGEVNFSSGDMEILSVPLYPEKAVPQAGFLKRLIDTAHLFFRKLFNLEKGLYLP